MKDAEIRAQYVVFKEKNPDLVYGLTLKFFHKTIRLAEGKGFNWRGRRHVHMFLESLRWIADDGTSSAGEIDYL